MNANEITIEIRGLESAAVKAAEQISALFPTTVPAPPSPLRAGNEVLVRIRADLGPAPDAGGYTDTCA
ncbi:hypothetical protein [Streptomyces katrae]|uniref:hypothetical protein n=1 Tax=Streptomyces katrae TaxID=68223 RepID=UPI000C2BF7D3|nr:hypothetical protein [Streptomyces katrae]